MKHAILGHADDPQKNCIEAGLTGERNVFLAQSQYSSEELEQFQEEAAKWIIRRSGTRYFLADSDSGEDAEGYYCGYFDLKPEYAVFDGGRLIGFYLYPGDLRYSGSDRSSFEIIRWGYPGHDLFAYVPRVSAVHVFLFARPDTHKWKDWDLLPRDPQKEYTSCITF